MNRPHNAGSNAPASGWRTAVAGQRSAARWRNRRAPPLLRPLLWLAAAAVLWVCIAPVQAQPATGAISGLRLSSDAPGELAVGWEPPSMAPADYRVDWARSDEEFRSYTVDENHLYPAGTASAVRISGLAAGVDYKVRVRARYAGWSGPWSEASLTVSAERSAAVTVRAQTQTAPGCANGLGCLRHGDHTDDQLERADRRRRLADQLLRAALSRNRGLRPGRRTLDAQAWPGRRGAAGDGAHGADGRRQL